MKKEKPASPASADDNSTRPIAEQPAPAVAPAMPPARRRAAARPAAKPAKPAAPAARKGAASSASAVVKKAAPNAEKPLSAKAEKAAKPVKAKKVKLVRDSFALPETEYAAIAALKKRLLALDAPAKKSELLRAGLLALSAMSDRTLTRALARVERIKTGRPKK